MNPFKSKGSKEQLDNRYKVFVLRDEKSQSYGMPITMISRGVMIREIQDRMAEGQAIFARHPQDFALFEIGDYDPASGDISLYEQKNCLGLVQDFRSSLGETKQ